MLQSMYQFKFILNPEMDNFPTKGVDVECLREIKIEDMKIPFAKVSD